VTFRVTAAAEVCVAFDDRVVAKPAWFKDWEDTGDDIVNTEPIPRTFSIFKKGFTANSVVTLGRNGQRGNHGDQYMVLVRRAGQRPVVSPLQRSLPTRAVEGGSGSDRRHGRSLTGWLRQRKKDQALVAIEPTKRSCFERLERAGVAIDTVVDVGVEEGTPELIRAYPRARHLLIEPLAAHNPKIEAAYADVPHEIFNVACSSEDGTCWLIATSSDASGRVTHAHIAEAPGSLGTGSMVGCEPIRRARLDSLGLPLGDHILLKVDVDGEDLEVLKGAGSLLDRAEVVVVEAPLDFLLERGNFLSARGFRFYDIVDLCYYHDILSQVDLVFIKRALFGRHAELNPWGTKKFSWDAYCPFTARLERERP